MDLEEINQSQEKPDFRRANGAPMVVVNGKNERFSRPSGWGKELDDENALVNWKIDTASKGVASDSALQAEWIAVKPEDKSTKAKLREKAIQAGRGNEASDTGTALHAMSERWEDPDDDFDPGKYRQHLESYSAEMQRIGIVSEMFEYTVVNVEYRSAGTCDRLYRLTRDLVTPKGTLLPAGTLLIGDLKTGKKLDFSLPGYHVQMALYAQGQLYNVETDEFMPTPDINTDWGLLVHMPADGDDAGTCQILWCDLEVGNYGAYLVHEIRDWRKKWRSGAYAAPLVEVGGTGRLVAEVVEPTNWLDDMIPFIKSRMAVMRENADALKLLTLKWPIDCPPPNKIETDEQVKSVLDLLDFIEAELGLPFPVGDPRVIEGVHADDLNTTNSPRSREKEVTQ